VGTDAVVGAVPAARRRRAPARPSGPELTALAFWAPAAVILLVWVIYPSVATVYRSFFDRAGQNFVGLANFQRIFTDPATLVVLRNNAIWVLVFPAVVTALGVVFAVLLERVPYKLVLRTLLFMPMAISLLASSVIWRIVYQTDPSVGLVNAPLAGVVNAVQPPGPYPGARPSQTDLVQQASDGSWRLTTDLSAGSVAKIGLVGFPPSEIQSSAQQAVEPPAQNGAITGVVWRDFTAGGGTPGVVDPGEKGMPGVKVDLVGPGGSTTQTTTGPDGAFTFSGVGSGPYNVQADAASFRTGNPQRDQTILQRRYLDASRYPVITFASHGIQRHDTGQAAGAIGGTLTVRGVERPVTLVVTAAEQAGADVAVSATLHIDRFDFGMTAMRGVAGRYLDLELAAICVPRPGVQSSGAHSSGGQHRG